MEEMMSKHLLQLRDRRLALNLVGQHPENFALIVGEDVASLSMAAVRKMNKDGFPWSWIKIDSAELIPAMQAIRQDFTETLFLVLVTGEATASVLYDLTQVEAWVGIPDLWRVIIINPPLEETASMINAAYYRYWIATWVALEKEVYASELGRFLLRAIGGNRQGGFPGPIQRLYSRRSERVEKIVLMSIGETDYEF